MNEELTILGDNVTNQVILEGIAAHLRHAGRAVSRITINGRNGLDLSEEQLTGDLTIEVMSTEISTLLRSTAADGVKFLAQLQQHVDSTAEAFTTGSNAAGYERLTLLAEALQCFMQLIQSFTVSGFEIPGCAATIGDLATVSAKIVDAQERGDLPAISDTLRFELKPLLAAWGAGLAAC